MFHKHTYHKRGLIFSVAVFLIGTICAQSTWSQDPQSPVSDSQERIRVFTEEMAISVSAYAHGRHFSAVLEPHDVLVFEDDVRQTVRSVRRLSANVLLALDTGGELNPAMRTSTTRNIASRLVSRLQFGDRIAAIQFGNKVELFQPWTTNRNELLRALDTKLVSGKRPQLASALEAAALQLNEVTTGTRHLVLITDGVDSSQDSMALVEAITKLLQGNVTVHVISYGSVGREKIDKQNPLIEITLQKRKSAMDLAMEIMNPTAIPEYKKFNKVYLVFDTDFSKRKQLAAYKEATKFGEVWLTNLAEETGGLVFAPRVVEEMIPAADRIASEIDSRYIVTYMPKRPLAKAPAGEYRRLNVVSGAAGVNMRARRGYVVEDSDKTLPRDPVPDRKRPGE